jgi:hypothetical protein
MKRRAQRFQPAPATDGAWDAKIGTYPISRMEEQRAAPRKMGSVPFSRREEQPSVGVLLLPGLAFGADVGEHGGGLEGA